MKKQPKIGKLTVIPPRKGRRRAQEPRHDVGIIEEAIGAAHAVIAAGKRAYGVYRKIRDKK